MLKRWILGIILALVVLYLLGPSPSTPVYEHTLPVIPSNAVDLENYVKTQEFSHKVKPDNEARIVWADDSTKQKTEFSIVYLHGFTASQGEGEPVHKDVAKHFHANLYLSRLADHGLDTSDPLFSYTAEKSWESAKEAYAIGRKLGNKVILMGTSTGGTLALMLAAAYPDVNSLVLLSPNIAINDPFAWVLNNHWGLQVARLILKGDFIHSRDQRAIYKQYWYSAYRAEGAVQLQELLETTMNKETFEKVKQPVLTLYYFRDNIHQDSVVKVSAIKTMMDELGTPANMKVSIAMSRAGDHVLGSYIKSKDLPGVEAAIEHYMANVLKIPAH